MLTEDQQKYLNSIPEDKRITVFDFDPAVKTASDKVIARIQAWQPNWDVCSMGSSELGIAGQNDIDMNIPIHSDEAMNYLPTLEQLFGPPRQRKRLPIKWIFEQDGFEVELYLTDKTTETFQEHLMVFELLKNQPELRARYETIKKSADGGSFRDYMKKKYEFFNEILNR